MRVFIGYDVREVAAYEVCRWSMIRRTSVPLEFHGLSMAALTYQKWYDRPYRTEGGRRIDLVDGKPFATDFAFTRFLVPALCDYEGWALFCDCDFLFMADPGELLGYRNDLYAAMVVQHDYRPRDSVKMDGQDQQHYPRKNWSSLILWNCGHPSNRALTPEAVSTRPGSWLHQFQWLKDKEIGELPEAWNWLEGWSPRSIKPKAVHFTSGGPWFPAYANVGYADEWRFERDSMRPATMELQECLSPPRAAAR